MNKTLEINQIIEYDKIFTIEEVTQIGNIMGFMGKHHEIPNENGQILNQGLLTAILTNRIGGEYNILMYRMEFDFIEKVWTDEKIRVINIVKDIVEKKGKKHVVIESEVYNSCGNKVLRGILKGILLEF